MILYIIRLKQILGRYEGKKSDDSNKTFRPSQPHFNSNVKYGLGGLGALGIGAGLWALRKHYKNKNRSFLQRLFNR